MVHEHAHEHPRSDYLGRSQDRGQPRLGLRVRRRVERPHEAGLPTYARAGLREFERERELRRAHEILKSAAASFGTEIDGRCPK